MEKMRVKLPAEHWSGFSYESIWVDCVSFNHYQVKNIPFYVEDLAPDDVVKGRSEDDRLVFESFAEHSGNSVLLCICNGPIAEAELLVTLKEMAFRYEV